MGKTKAGVSSGSRSCGYKICRRFLAASATFVASTLVTSHALAVADFSGHWVAPSGTVSSTIGISSTCTKIELRLEQTATELTTHIYDATCKSYGTKWGPVVQTIRGNKVFEIDRDGDEEEVGTISDDTLITISRSGTTKYAWNLKLITARDGTKTLQSYYGTKGPIGAIATEGIHELVP